MVRGMRSYLVCVDDRLAAMAVALDLVDASRAVLRQRRLNIFGCAIEQMGMSLSSMV